MHIPSRIPDENCVALHRGTEWSHTPVISGGFGSMRYACTLPLLFLLAVPFSDTLGQSAVPSKASADARLAPLKDLNGFFPLHVPDSKGQWQERAAALKRRILVATGLWPLPERTPLNPVIHGKVTRPPIDEVRGGIPVKRIGFSVERVYFESMPDHYVTGLLFRPEDGKSEKRPAVLCPHGHGGRLQRHGPEKIVELVASGEERFFESGQYPKLARCAHLARMGCVVFIFDMLGYADSQQISRELAHGFSKQRPDFEGAESWGLFSAQAEMRLQSVMGIQTWNSVRCLDFLEQLPDVDGDRIAVTGGSGGGTQTILLCAIDDRPVAAFPNGMVSSSMQGGCTCENCSLLRVGTGNVELAALFAPKPQAMTAADDWTRHMLVEGKGFPELQRVYGLLDAKQNVQCVDVTHFGHNYNYVSRAIMYQWFNRHLNLGLPETYIEEDYELLSAEEMSVWNDEHPRPPGGDAYERALTRSMAKASDVQMAKLIPKDEASFKSFQRVVGGAIATLVGRKLPSATSVEAEKLGEMKHDGYLSFEHVVRHTSEQEFVPITTLWPVNAEWNGDVVVWVDGKGKKALYDGGHPNAHVRRLLEGGATVVGPQLLLQDSESMQRVVSNPREAAAYSFCYNHTLFAQRVHDVLTLIAYVRSYQVDGETPKRLHLVGVNGAGPIVASARAIAGELVDRAVVQTDRFRFASLTSFRDPSFLPGAVKYGDLPAMLALSAPHETCIVGESTADMPVTVASFRAAGGAFVSRDLKGSVEWIARED